MKKHVNGSKSNVGSPPRVIPPAKSSSPSPAPARVRSPSPTNDECIANLQHEYDQFKSPSSPGRKLKRDSLVTAVLAKTDIFTEMKAHHFAVLLAIAPEKMSVAIVTYMKNNPELFSAMITDSVVKPFALIQNLDVFQSLVYQWVIDNFFKKELCRNSEVMQWMFLNDRLKEEHWQELFRLLCAGDCRELLKAHGSMGPVLWEKLCQFLSENKKERDQCLCDAKNKQFLATYLQHLSLEQRIALFNGADSALMQKLFEACAESRRNCHVLHSVLNGCFRQIDNACFYAELLKEEYAHFAEYAIDVAGAEDLELFVTKHQGKSWCVHDNLKKRNGAKAGPNFFNIKDRVRIAKCLDAIFANALASKGLDERLLINYYLLHDPEIAEKLWANPVLMARLLELHKAKKISIDVCDDIIPILKWMLGQLLTPKSFHHLLNSETMVRYFIAAIEWIFCQLPNAKGLPSLESLFEHFGLILFSGVTTEQLAQLAKMRGNNEVIFAEFATQFPTKVNCYRTLKAAKDKDIKKRWSETVGDLPAFVAEFQYRWLEDVERWMDLLLCKWNDNLQESFIFDTVIQRAKGLCLATFLRAISRTPKLNELFIAKPELARKVLGNPHLIAACGFSLDIFGRLDCELLLKVISDPELHKLYGFTPQRLYQFIIGNMQADMFKEGEGFLAKLLSHPRMTEYARVFLNRAFSMAPSYLKTPPVKATTDNVKPWVAERRPYRKYTHTVAFDQKVDTKILIQRLSALRNGPSKDIPESYESYLNDLFELDRIFVENLIKSIKVNDDEKAAMDKIKAEVNKQNISKLLNTNRLIRGLDIMRNPTWLKIGIDCVLGVKMTTPLDGKLATYVTSFLQLPGFRPTTADLSPSYLQFDTTSTAIEIVVKEKSFAMVEYAIDLCHYPVEKMEANVQVRAQALVQTEIECYFNKLAKLPDLKVEDYKVQRFICLLCSATEFLEPGDLLAIFDSITPLRDQLCQWLLSYNLSALSVAEVPAMVRLQMLVLRSFTNELQQLDDDKIQRDKKVMDIERKLQETENWAMSKQRCSGFFNEILWHLSYITAEANLNISPLYQLDSQMLKHLPKDALLANLLRYEFLTTQLTEHDLSDLVDGDPGPDVAQACLMHSSLHRGCSNEFLNRCVKKLGYGDNPAQMVARVTEEMGPVIAGSPRLQDWIHSIEEKDSNLLASGPR